MLHRPTLSALSEYWSDLTHSRNSPNVGGRVKFLKYWFIWTTWHYFHPEKVSVNFVAVKISRQVLLCTTLSATVSMWNNAKPCSGSISLNKCIFIHVLTHKCNFSCTCPLLSTPTCFGHLCDHFQVVQNKYQEYNRSCV